MWKPAAIAMVVFGCWWTSYHVVSSFVVDPTSKLPNQVSTLSNVIQLQQEATTPGTKTQTRLDAVSTTANKQSDPTSPSPPSSTTITAATGLTFADAALTISDATASLKGQTVVVKYGGVRTDNSNFGEFDFNLGRIWIFHCTCQGVETVVGSSHLFIQILGLFVFHVISFPMQ